MFGLRMQVSSVLTMEALVKDAKFFDRLMDEMVPLGYASLDAVVEDEGLMKLIGTLYKCFIMAVGK